MLTHLFLTALLSFLCWWFVPLWWFLGAFARPESVSILIQNNLNKLDKAMRFGYAVRQAEIRHQALLSWFGNHGNGHNGPWNGRDLPPAHTLLFSFAAKGRCILPPLGTFIYLYTFSTFTLRFCGNFMNLLTGNRIWSSLVALARQMMLWAPSFPYLWNLRCVERCGDLLYSTHSSLSIVLALHKLLASQPGATLTHCAQLWLCCMLLWVYSVPCNPQLCTPAATP